MKIISLTSENIKRLTAVHIEPNGNLVTISGKNGSGKTSVLDSIWWALAGAGTVQKNPIRNGQVMARIILNLGELIITRTFKVKDDNEFTTQIKVETADGAAFKSPQKMLDELLGELTFDPLAFSRMAPKDQFNAMRKFVPDVDFDAIAAHHQGDFNRRAELNKAIKEMEGALAINTVPDEPPGQPVDESELMIKLQQAGDQNTETERRRANRQTMAESIASRQNDITDLRERAAALRKQADELDAKVKDIQTEIDDKQKRLDEAPPLPELIDTAAVIEELNGAKEKNRQYQNWLDKKNKKAELVAKIAEHKTKTQALTDAMEARQKAKRDAIAAAKIPVPGVEFGDDQILLNGVPFEQGSDAEQLKASIAIAMGLNPKLRVIRVRDGSLLDDDSMKILDQMCNDKDFQCWIEKVDSSGKMGFVLEDGHLKNAEVEQ